MGSRNVKRHARRGGPLREPAFRLYWASRLMCNVGTFAQAAVIAWIVVREGGGALHLGFVLALSTLPVGLFSLAGGAFADYLRLRSLVVVLELGLAATAGTLAVLEIVRPLALWEISAAAAVTGTLGALAAPSGARMLRAVVDEDDMPAAIALGGIEYNLGRIVGPAFGGLLIAIGDSALCFAFNAASYLAFALVAAWVPLRREPPRAQRLSVRRGLRAVRAVAPLTTVALVLGPIGLLGFNLSAIASLVSDNVLRVDATGFGLVMSAAGVGAVAAGLVIATRNRVSLRTFLVGSLAVSTALILIAASRAAAVVVAGFVVFGIGGSFVLASATTLFQRLAPADAEGTALGVYSLLVTGTTPLGSLLVGALAEAAGIRVTTALLGVGCLVAVAIGATIAYRHHQLGVEVDRGRVAW